MNKETIPKGEEIQASGDSWIKIPNLYNLFITVDTFRNYKNVGMRIIRARSSNVPFDPMDCIPKDVDINKLDKFNKSLMLAHFREHFLSDEIKQIKKYLSSKCKTHIGRSELCELPNTNDLELQVLDRLPMDRNHGFYPFYKEEDYPLGDLKIEGSYYDLLSHEYIKPDFDKKRVENKKLKEGIKK